MGTSRPIFNHLDANGQFHRDTALGRIFHPGSVSFREISAKDSLHISVLPGNRLSVHVDRLSPLVVRADRCRYSAARVVAHNLAVAAEVLLGLVTGRMDRPRCELDCELVWVPDEVGDEEPTGQIPQREALPSVR